MKYFSEREQGESPRSGEDLTGPTWTGLQSEIAKRINDGSFGATYPEICHDGGATVGADQLAFWNAMHARMPSLEERPWLYAINEPPPVPVVMDIIEFCWQSVGKPLAIPGGYHPFFKHHHLKFNIDAGRAEFRDAINDIFRRNGLVFELTAQGAIERLAPPVLQETLTSATFATGDALLDGMLEDARRKYMSPDEPVRREALEKLWDAFERIKTLEPGAGKAVQAKAPARQNGRHGQPEVPAASRRGGFGPDKHRQHLSDPAQRDNPGAAFVQRPR
jgi:hypothetical protein